MTYLQLFQRFAHLAGVTQPTTTVGQTGEQARWLALLAQAYNEIQIANPKRWRFMWNRGQFETLADGTKDYDPGSTTIDSIDPDSWTIYKTADGEATESWLEFKGYKEFRAEHGAGTSDSDIPSVVTILPNKNIRLEPPPNAACTVQFDYYRTPDTLSGDADVPILPGKYHDIIVYLALTKFGLYEEARDVVAGYTGLYAEIFNRMEWEELVEEEFPMVEVV